MSSLVGLSVHRAAAQHRTVRSVARCQACRENVNNTIAINKDNYQDSLYISVTIHDQQSWRICSIRIQTCLCVHCVSTVFVCLLCLCVHCVCVSIGRSKFRQAKGALKFRHSKLTSSRCRTKNTQNLPENKTHYDRSESLSLSLSHTLYSHISRCHDTSHKSPNCDLPVKKQTILQWYTGTQNMLIRSRYTTCLLPANCTSSYNTTVTVTCFVRLLRVAILREYISQGRYAC